MNPRSRWLPALVVAAALLVVGVAAALPLAPRGPLGADAAQDEFSASRAAGTLSAVARRPHPVGSAANTTVREYLIRQLTALGLTPQVQERTAAREYSSGPASVGRVTELLSRIPGTASTGRVLLVAHYDSVMVGPGASDDGIGVASILEIGRTLAAAGPQRNDVELLLTDGEEAGLLGSRAFTEADRDRPTVVLNLEARGTSGPVVMFETGDGNSTLVPALRGAVPVATSVSDEIYDLLPNDTDFTEFRRVGFTGMNFAVVSGSARYHTPTDSVANVDRASVQDMGTVVLSATRRLAGADLAADGGDATYFTLFGLLVSYPMWLALPLALLALAGLLVAVFLRRAAALAVSPGAVGGLAAAALLVPAVAGAVGYLAWLLLLRVRPHLDGFLTGDPYRPGVIAAGLSLVAVAVAVSWLVVARRWARAVEIPIAAALLFAVLGVLAAVLVPGAAYLLTWPALLAAVAVALVLLLRGDGGSPWRSAAVGGALGVPAVALLLPIVVVLFPTTGLVLAAAPMAVVALLAVAALPLPAVLPARRWARALPTLAVLLVGLATTAVGIQRNDVTADRPAQVSLLYTRDLDSGTSGWASGRGAPDGWLDQYVDGDGEDVEDRFPTLTIGPYQLGDAPAAEVTTPEITVLGSRDSGGGRELRLRLRPVGGEAYLMALFVDTTGHELVSASIDTEALRGGGNRTTDTPWKWGAYVYGVPAAGVEVTLTVRGDGPVPVRVVAHSAGLPAGLAQPPDTLTWTAQDWAGETVVTRTTRA